MSFTGTILLVPGIGGNTLATQPTLFGLGPRVILWLDPGALIAGGWRLMGLSPDGITPDVPLTGPLVAGGPLADYYGSLGAEFSSRGWRVAGAQVDWRLTIQRNAERLADVVHQLRPFKPLHIVAHSRGGLVARAAIPLITAAGDLDVCGWCAGLGVPHYGSWEAAGLLAGWNQTAALLEGLLGPSSAIAALGGAFGAVRAVIVTWPGAYALLPSPAAPGILPAETAAVYDPGAWVASGVPVSAAWLAYTLAQWPSIPLVPPSVDWIDVVGTGFPTAVQMRFPPNLASSQGFLWSTAGDSTVPSAWAVQPGRRRITCPTSHGALAYDGRVLTVLSDALRDGLKEDVTINGPLL